MALDFKRLEWCTYQTVNKFDDMCISLEMFGGQAGFFKPANTWLDLVRVWDGFITDECLVLSFIVQACCAVYCRPWVYQYPLVVWLLIQWLAVCVASTRCTVCWTLPHCPLLTMLLLLLLREISVDRSVRRRVKHSQQVSPSVSLSLSLCVCVCHHLLSTDSVGRSFQLLSMREFWWHFVFNTYCNLT